MNISVYKFNPDAPDLPQEDIEKVKSNLEGRLLKNITVCSAAEDLWHHGWYDSLGYRYTLDDEVRVLVNNTSEVGNDWREHVVPTDDPEVIEKYIKAFEGDDCAWIYLKQEDINVI